MSSFSTSSNDNHNANFNNKFVPLLYKKRELKSKDVRKHLEGIRLTKEHYDTLVNSDCNFYDEETGALIFKFRTNRIQHENIRIAKACFGTIDTKMKMSKTRGAAAGKIVKKKLLKKRLNLRKEIEEVQQVSNGFGYIKYKIDVSKLIDYSIRDRFPGETIGEEKIFQKNGKAMKYSWTSSSSSSDSNTGKWVELEEVTSQITNKKKTSNPVRSYKAGWYYDMYLKSNRKWGFSKEYPRTWERAAPFFEDINHQFEKILPEVHKVHTERLLCHSDTVVANDVALSSCSINVNYSSFCHMDRGDLKDGFSTLTVIQIGEYEGGLFVIPEYRIAIDVREGDILFCQSHKLWHGNTKIKSIQGGKRISFVTYLKEALIRGTIEMLKTQRREGLILQKTKSGEIDDNFIFQANRLSGPRRVFYSPYKIGIEHKELVSPTTVKRKSHPRNHLKRKRYKNDKKKEKRQIKLFDTYIGEHAQILYRQKWWDVTVMEYNKSKQWHNVVFWTDQSTLPVCIDQELADGLFRFVKQNNNNNSNTAAGARRYMFDSYREIVKKKKRVSYY